MAFYSIFISLNQRKLFLYDENHNLIKAYPVGIGKMLTTTPTGQYKIISKVPHPGGPFGVLWMGLSRPHYGIHGTNAPWSIGHQVSHGCVRMYNNDVLELSRMVPIGTSVLIRQH
ncbi:MAG TPA: L,D-transpeptidase [Bacillota bacterium]|nr:L,D-transpeptidase [Bacillota bacterium]